VVYSDRYRNVSVYAMLYTTDCLVMLLGEDITTFDCESQKRSGYCETSTEGIGVTIILLIIIKGPEEV